MLRELAELTHARRGRPAVVPRARLRERGAGDRRAGHRPRRAHGEGAPADPGHRQEHRRQDPRAARDRPVAKLEALRAKHPPSVVALLRIQGLGPKALRKLRASSASASIDDLRARARRAPRARAARASARSPRRSSRARSRASTRRARSTARRSRSRCRSRRASSSALREVPGVTHAVVLRLAAPLLARRSATSTSWWRRATPGPVMEALRRDERRRPRARARRVEDQRRHPPRHADRPARRRAAPARRRAALLHRLEGPQHQAAPARARARLDAERVRALRARGRRASSRARPRSRSTRRSGCRGSRRCCARTRARSRRPSRARCRGRSAPSIGDFHVHTTRLGRRPLDARGGGRGGARARLPRARDHRPRRGHALGRRPRGAARAARASIRALQAAARRLARAAARRRAQHRPATASSTTTPSSARAFDWCLASVHDHFELDRAAQTRRVVTAMQDPSVRMIGHLSARMIGGRPPIELDLDAIFAAAEATGTALEINGALPRLDLSVEALRRARGRDVTFVLSQRRAPRARARARRVRGAQRRARLGRAGARRERLAGRAAGRLGAAAAGAGLSRAQRVSRRRSRVGAWGPRGSRSGDLRQQRRPEAALVVGGEGRGRRDRRRRQRLEACRSLVS